MSAAIKRLSTIIRKEPSKTESNLTAPVAPDTEHIPEMNSPSAPAPTSETTADPSAAAATATGPPADLIITPPAVAEPPSAKDQDTAPSTTADAPATTTAETPQQHPATVEPTAAAEGKIDSSTSPAAAKKSDTKHETTSVKEKSRRTRDIGRDTIRRFSTILRPGNGSHSKEKDLTPPVPTPASKAKEDDAVNPAEAAPVAGTELPAATVAPTESEPAPAAVPAPVVAEKTKDAKPAKPTAVVTKKEKVEKPKTAVPRRGSSFFSAARDVVRGPRKDSSKSKPVSNTKGDSFAAASKIVKKGAAKGKRVVVITGASKGAGLEFVKQYAIQTDTFVIALSRTVDKAAEIKTIVNESAKFGHNVRPVRIDIGSTKSVVSAVKEIVELTDGRIDLLIHAAGTQNERTIRIGDIKGIELEEELRYNLVGPIALTNALLPYLKPFPPPPPPPALAAATEVKEAEDKAKAEKAEEPEVETVKEGESAIGAIPQDTTSPVPAQTEETDAGTASTALPSTGEPNTTIEEVKPKDVETVITAAEVPLPPDTTPAPVSALVEQVAVAPVPTYLPPHPCVVFLAPSDPIYNNQGSVTTGSFVPSPKTLFSISRTALQVAIAQYGTSLGGQPVIVVGLERPGVLDPHTTITDAQAAKSVLEYLPSVELVQSGKLLKV